MRWIIYADGRMPLVGVGRVYTEVLRLHRCNISCVDKPIKIPLRAKLQQYAKIRLHLLGNRDQIVPHSVGMCKVLSLLLCML